jgi:hypothetical protein
MKFLLHILFLTLIYKAGFSQQYLQNKPEVIIENNVTSLTIRNCLSKASCYTDYYEFNSCGKLSKEMPAMIGNYVKYEYNDKCNLLINWGMNHTQSADSIWRKAEYIYTTTDTILINSYFEDGKEISSDTSKFNSHHKTYLDLTINKKGQVIEYTNGDLYYPCGIHFVGRHKFKYSYSENGLITNAIIYNKAGEVIVNLEYTYATKK